MVLRMLIFADAVLADEKSEAKVARIASEKAAKQQLKNSFGNSVGARTVFLGNGDMLLLFSSHRSILSDYRFQHLDEVSQ